MYKYSCIIYRFLLHLRIRYNWLYYVDMYFIFIGFKCKIWFKIRYAARLQRKHLPKPPTKIYNKKTI